MANPRETNSQFGVGYVSRTYPHDSTIVYDSTLAGGSAQVGLAVTLVASNQVALVADAGQVEGCLMKVEPGGFCVVQTGGTAQFKGGTGAALTPGGTIVGAVLGSAKGYIRVAAASAAELVLARGRILDATTTTAVLVALEDVGNGS